VQRDFRTIEHHQQFGLVGVKSSQQVPRLDRGIQRDEAGAAEEDKIEPRNVSTTLIHPGSEFKLVYSGRLSGFAVDKIASPWH
jgi:hypothetical protein